MAADGLPGPPCDAQDDQGDGEADEWIGDLQPKPDDGGGRDDGQRDVGVGAGVVAVGDQRRAGEPAAGARAHDGGHPVAGEPERARGGQCPEVLDGARVDELPRKWNARSWLPNRRL